MALAFEVCQLRDTSYSASANNSNGQKSCQLTLTKKFLVKASDSADSDFGPDDVTDYQVAFATGIPIVNYHTWYDPNTGVSIPMAVCKSKSVKRLDANGTVFEVSCTFQTESSGNGKQAKREEVDNPDNPDPKKAEDIEDASDIDPVWTRSVTGRDVVMHSAVAYHSDNSALTIAGQNPDGSPKPISTKFLPVDNVARVGNGDPNLELRNEINQPVTYKQPMLQITITQFEDDVTDSNLLARCFSVNKTAWNTGNGGPTYPAKSAMIKSMNAVKQSVTAKKAGGGVKQVEMYRVTYTILVDQYTVQNSTGSLFVGHAAAVPMIGHWHEDPENEGKALQFTNPKSGLPTVGLIDFNGVPKADQDESPDYVRYDTVAETEFADFLEDRP